MYIESVPNRGSPPAILLRESFREQGRVRKRTLANLSAWPSALVEGFRTLLKGGVAVAAEGIRIRRALPHGHAAAVLSPSAATVPPMRCGATRPHTLPSCRSRIISPFTPTVSTRSKNDQRPDRSFP